MYHISILLIIKNKIEHCLTGKMLTWSLCNVLDDKWSRILNHISNKNSQSLKKKKKNCCNWAYGVVHTTRNMNEFSKKKKNKGSDVSYVGLQSVKLIHNNKFIYFLLNSL